MKKITIKTYSYDELDDRGKEKARENYADINVFDRWWDGTYDYFKEIASTLGLDVNLKQTYFSGFYDQGSGSSYTASVNILGLLTGVKKQAWKELSPTLELDLSPCPVSPRIVALIQRNWIDTWAEVKDSNRGTNVQVDAHFDYNENACQNYTQIESQLEKLKDWVIETCRDLNHFFFQSLQDEYEYLVSREQIEETIRTNEYHFTAEGSRKVYL